MKNLNIAATPLEKVIQRILNKHAPDYPGGVEDVLALSLDEKIAHITELRYCTDSLRLYKKHKDEINDLLGEVLQAQATNHACPGQIIRGWDEDDPLALQVSNRGLLVWWALDQIGRTLINGQYESWKDVPP